ncbi:MAG: hypothetical protein ACRCTJ_03685 [Brevinema sp.]
MIGFKLLLFFLIISCTDPNKKKNKAEGEILFFSLPISIQKNKQVQFWNSLEKFLDQNQILTNHSSIPNNILNQYMILYYDFGLENFYTDKIVYEPNELLIYLLSSEMDQKAQDQFPILFQKLEFKKIIFYKNNRVFFVTNISSSL